MMSEHWPFDAAAYLHEFKEFLPAVDFSDRNPLNTEMFYLWCMIRTMRPAVMIESGTFRGYSAHFICEALRLNGDGAQFVTYGFNSEKCLPFARGRLEDYPNAKVVECDSRIALKEWPVEFRPAAFFIDGPKGRNMPPLFRLITKRFKNILFIAVHDCEEGGTSRNRWYVERCFGDDYPLRYCDELFQTKFGHLDDNLVGASERINWRPFEKGGQETPFYGTATGYVMVSEGRVGTRLSRLFASIYRSVRFGIIQYVALRVRSRLG
jgi:hypothetical protein